MTFHARRCWPAVAERVRNVIETRTASGETCTVIVEREADGPLLVSFHGAWHTTAAPCRDEATALIKALQRAVE